MDASAREKSAPSSAPNSPKAGSEWLEMINQGTASALAFLKEGVETLKESGIFEQIKEFAPELSSFFKSFLGKAEGQNSDTEKTSPLVVASDQREQASSQGEVKKDPISPEEKPVDKNKDALKKEKKEEDNKRYKAVAEMPSIKALQNISNPNSRVAAISKELMKLDVRGKHCWDWVDVIYNAAKVKRKGVFSSFKDYQGRDCGSHHASKTLVDNLGLGDHIFINNKNQTDKHGNHSVIFLGWVDKTLGVARLAQLPKGSSRPASITIKDIRKKNPVVYIAKPVNES